MPDGSFGRLLDHRGPRLLDPGNANPWAMKPEQIRELLGPGRLRWTTSRAQLDRDLAAGRYEPDDLIMLISEDSDANDAWYFCVHRAFGTRPPWLSRDEWLRICRRRR